MAWLEPPIAYVLGTFPQPSQTFIAREVRGLLAAGVRLQIFALRRRSADALEAPDREWFPLVRFAPRSLAPSTLAASAWWLRRDAHRYWRALRAVVALPHRPRILRIRAVALFARAAWIAREIERGGGCRQVHAHFALAQTEVAMAVGVLLGRPFSFTAHARDIYATPSALAEKMRASCLVVTCTAYNLEHLRQLCPDLPANRVQLVYHGVDPGALAAKEAAPLDPPLILAAGRLVEKKGFSDLIAACAVLRDRGVTFRCRIAGSGPMRAHLARAIREAALAELVELPGWTPADELSSMMRTAAVVVVPSRISKGGDRDGIPNFVLEAMAAARPVIATHVSGIPEAVKDGITGCLVPPANVAALADAIERIVMNPAEAGRLGRAGRSHAKDTFELGRSSARLAALFAAMA